MTGLVYYVAGTSEIGVLNITNNVTTGLSVP